MLAAALRTDAFLAAWPRRSVARLRPAGGLSRSGWSSVDMVRVGVAGVLPDVLPAQQHAHAYSNLEHLFRGVASSIAHRRRTRGDGISVVCASWPSPLMLKRPGFGGGSGYWIPTRGWSVREAA